MRRNAVLSAAVLGAILVLAPRARAQGYGVYEHGTCVMGRAGTGVAAPCSGGSPIFYNPAGIVGGENKWAVEVGGTRISPRYQFRDSLTGVTTPAVEINPLVPHVYVTRQITSRWAAGLGVFAPYGLRSEWPTTFSGRFLAYVADLKSIYIQPTVAFAVSPRVSIGVGLDYVHMSVELQQRVDLSSQVATIGPGNVPITFGMLGIPVGTDFADATVKGSGNGTGAHFGILLKPWDWLSVGGRVLTRVRVNGAGTANFTPYATNIVLPAGNPLGVPGGTPLDAVVASAFQTKLYSGQAVHTRLPNPEQLVVGVALKPTHDVTLLADYQYVNWGVFDVLGLDFDSAGSRTVREDYRATSGWRGAIEIQPTSRLQVRGGLLTHDAAAPSQTVTPLLPEAARVEGTLGASYWVTPKMRLDIAYQYIRQQDRRGRVGEYSDGRPPDVALNNGLYTSTAKLYGASLAVWF
jgi:long-chain fatty acid transport protein